MLSILKQIAKVSLLVLALFSIQNVVKVKAQTLPGSQTDTITLTATPENPNEGDNVSLTLSSFSVNLDTSKITWYIDGVAKKDAIGIKDFITRAKTGGQNTSVRVVVTTAEGVTVEVKKEIAAANVDLVIEPTSYTPPFYKGRSIFVTQGTVRITAVPDVLIDNKKADAKNLIFKWRKDGTYLIDDSGMGKNSVTVSGGVPIRDINLSVEVLDSSGNTVAKNNTLITINNPKIVFYESNPLYGILYNKAVVGSYYLGLKEEVSIIAKPFYFNLLSDAGSDSIYKWTINGGSINSSGRPNVLLLKQETTNLAGTASVLLNLNNKSKIFQYTSGGFNVIFGQ